MARAPTAIAARERPISRRGLSRVEAAEYIGISPSKFDELIADGRMPGARRIDGRKIWDVRELDLCFDDLPRDDSAPSIGNSWDDR
jgi:excisionase family DNA binding protein